MPVRFLVLRALALRPMVRLGWGAFSAHPLVTTACRALRGRAGSRLDGWRLCRLPRRLPLARFRWQSGCQNATPCRAAFGVRAEQHPTAEYHGYSRPTVLHNSATVFRKTLAVFDLLRPASLTLPLRRWVGVRAVPSAG